ncbi:hypothetical protein PM082_009108 [Marasmius tenuissimus]|nr:hypothetical protein PM082_009108 [Marasmius tenuissimus]
MLHLSKNSGRHPTCLSIQNVKRVGEFPVAAGGFGDVWKGTIGDSSELVCLKVVKVYLKSDLQKLSNEYLREAILWRQMKHPNVLPFLGLYELEQTQQLCLISPWMEEGNLVEFLKSREREDTDHYTLVYDIASGLAYLHSKKIVHGDLKGLNILITRSFRACIADFGLSRVAHTQGLRITTSATRPVGTARWLAPELLLSGEKPSKHSDIYSFACVCYKIFTQGLQPFPELANEMAVAFNVAQGKRPSRPEETPELSDPMWALMTVCWDPTPSSRPSAQILLEKVTEMVPLSPAPDWSESLSTQMWENVEYRFHSPISPADSDIPSPTIQPEAEASPVVPSATVPVFKDEMLFNYTAVGTEDSLWHDQYLVDGTSARTTSVPDTSDDDDQEKFWQRKIGHSKRGETPRGVAEAEDAPPLNRRRGSRQTDIEYGQHGHIEPNGSPRMNARSSSAYYTAEDGSDSEGGYLSDHDDGTEQPPCYEPPDKDDINHWEGSQWPQGELDSDWDRKDSSCGREQQDKDGKSHSREEKDRNPFQHQKCDHSHDQDLDVTQEIIPPDKDIKRLFQDCIIGEAHASLLSQAPAHTTPEDFLSDSIEGQNNGIIIEFRVKCARSRELIATRIPWATAGTERSRREFNAKHEAEGEPLSGKGEGETTEERLLSNLLATNEVLLGVLGQYGDLERAASELRAKESPKDVVGWRTKDQTNQQLHRQRELHEPTSSHSSPVKMSTYSQHLSDIPRY